MDENAIDMPMFAVDLVLGGITLGSDSDAPEKINSGFSMRPYLKNVRAAWLDKEKALVSIYIETEGLDEDSSGRGMAEEVFEVAHGYLREVVGTYVEIVRVERIDSTS